MIVGSWMQANPVTIPSDTLVSKAKHVMSESALHALPVVDGGRLRGLVTRANLLRTGHFVLRTQNANELNFFANRLRVRDIMVRSPATVSVRDTMEYCLLKGQELRVAQFPVMDGDQVVGIISANEIFQLAAQLLGAWERRSGVTLAPIELGPGVLGRIAVVTETAQAVVQALYPVGRDEAKGAGGYPHKRVIVRFHAADVAAVVRALEAAGFSVIESHDVQLPLSAAA